MPAPPLGASVPLPPRLAPLLPAQSAPSAGACAGPAVFAHASHWRPSTRELVLVAGCEGRGALTSAVHIMRVDARAWESPASVSGTPPPQCDQCAAAALGDTLYVIGGNDGARSLADVHTFDLNARRWTRLEPQNGAAFGRREGHTAVAAGNRIFVFGGACQKDGADALGSQQRFGDVVELDVSDPGRPAWRSHAVSGKRVPCPRSGHSCVVVPGARAFLVHGGQDEHGNFLNDTYLFDVDAMEWEHVPFTCSTRACAEGGPALAVPTGRAGHAMVLVEHLSEMPAPAAANPKLKNMHLVVIGGYTSGMAVLAEILVADLTAGSWLRIASDHSLPESRFGMTALCVDDLRLNDSRNQVSGKWLLLFGGCTDTCAPTRDAWGVWLDDRWFSQHAGLPQQSALRTPQSAKQQQNSKTAGKQQQPPQSEKRKRISKTAGKKQQPPHSAKGKEKLVARPETSVETADAPSGTPSPPPSDTPPNPPPSDTPPVSSAPSDLPPAPPSLDSEGEPVQPSPKDRAKSTKRRLGADVQKPAAATSTGKRSKNAEPESSSEKAKELQRENMQARLPLHSDAGLGEAPDLSPNESVPLAPGESIAFEGIVNGTFHHGATIEATVQGAVMRGLLFAGVPGVKDVLGINSGPQMNTHRMATLMNTDLSSFSMKDGAEALRKCVMYIEEKIKPASK